MKIVKGEPLSKYTTFKIGGPAKFFCVVKNEEDVVEAVAFAKKENVPLMTIGGGSNILVSDNGFDGLVMKNEVRPPEVRPTLSAGAGEVWDEFVERTVSIGLFGLENLSAIPGTVGAAPVQNIGAYGVEVGGLISMVRAYDTEKLEFVEFTNKECRFGYRNSLFKYHKHRYIITRVDFVLSKNGKMNISYKDLAEHFNGKSPDGISLIELRNAVIEIRRNKLPDWKKWGTAGSYFKNPIIPVQQFEELKKKYSGLPGFVEPNSMVKVSLGWILDKVCNAKGIAYRRASTYDKQALVIISKPGASAEEVVGLANTLMNMVKEKTGIIVESEVEWVC